MHYSRFKAHGTPHAPARPDAGTVCLAPDCEDKPVARGQCKAHYYENRRRRTLIRKGEALSFGPQAYSIDKSQKNTWREDLRERCSVDECVRTSRVRGYCGAHYQRWRRFGDPTFVPPEADKVCQIEGCERVTNARGLCGAHYYRWKTYGDPLASAIRKAGKVAKREPRHCITCGNLFDPGASSVRKYCGRKCAPKRRGGSVNKRSVVERLGKRDGWICHLCGLTVDRNLYWPNGQAGSVDHVIAVYHGGSDEDSNLRLSHLTCNTARGHKALI